MFLKHHSPLDIKLLNKSLLLSIINIDDSPLLPPCVIWMLIRPILILKISKDTKKYLLRVIFTAATLTHLSYVLRQVRYCMYCITFQLHFKVQNMHMLYLPIFVEICRQILKFCRFCRQKNMTANWKLYCWGHALNFQYQQWLCKASQLVLKIGYLD